MTSDDRLREVLRYMRTSKNESNESIRLAALDALSTIDRTAQVRYVADEFSCRVGDDEVVLVTPHGEEHFPSTRLSEFMHGHTRVGLFCVTLGLEVDRTIELASHTNLLSCLALQAAAATKIEEECDMIQQTVFGQPSSVKRYSPGYYDLQITTQRQLFRILDVERRIGVKLTDACEMVPLKTVSAFVAL